MTFDLKPIGSQWPPDVETSVAVAMEATAMEAWRNRSDSIMVVTFTGSRLVRVRCTDQWFDGLGSYGNFKWEELIVSG